MKPIDNWRQAWRMTSMQLAALAVIFGTLPADTQAAVLDMAGVPATRVPAILGLLFMAGRLVGQPRLDNATPKGPEQ